MKLTDLRSALNQRLFAPLLLHISGGKTIEVRHPELCVPGISSAFFGFPAPEDAGGTAYARYMIVDLNHIISLEPLKVPATPGNGQ